MEGNPVLGCSVGLVDVDAFHWAAEWVALGRTLRGSSDGVVEDEDARGAGAGFD